MADEAAGTSNRRSSTGVPQNGTDTPFVTPLKPDRRDQTSQLVTPKQPGHGNFPPQPIKHLQAPSPSP